MEMYFVTIILLSLEKKNIKSLNVMIQQNMEACFQAGYIKHRISCINNTYKKETGQALGLYICMRRIILGSNQTFLRSGTVSKSHRILLSVEETLQGDNSRIDFLFFFFFFSISSQQK